jgi:hypothetical protein
MSDSGCRTSSGLYCNMTGQYTNIWNWNIEYVGRCFCKPNYYWSNSYCMPQLTFGGNCTSNSLSYVYQCNYDYSYLYCDTSTPIPYKCKCLSNYYWSPTASKCCK